ncbi:ABC transporter substrate-binding protein [Hyphomicrobium sp. B1]|uniref:ABC transporter substrate-binding protein n=1 Tax=unclassified Hyphomicrobium TaxID=2619925 RepID=UPI000213D60A|nr:MULTISPECIES: ABC transporter substrate-binding protein [unclassified Hyphomicrobium]CCB66270.1 ABC transporter, periplasmic protein [Hyphomicrobium sp. MC1]
MARRLRIRELAVLAVSMFAVSAANAWAEPLKIGYSDWPGWVAWQVAIDKGWFKEAGVDVDFEWFDYVPSMDAFSAGKLDGVTVTNGDALVMGGSGTKNTMIMLTDYSNGNDMIVGVPGIKSLKDLKGKKVGIEVGFVEHLLLLNGLEKNGMTESDVTLVNTKTNETPQTLASGEVSAIGAWQPNSGQAMKQVPGSTPIYTSADEPGLIYDVITVNPTSLATRKADWEKVIKVWDRVVKYINDPATVDDAAKIMAARVGLKPEEYKPLIAGTKLLDVAAAKKVFVKAKGFGSLYGSSEIANDFNTKYAVYKDKLDVDSFIDPSLTNAQP